MSPRLLLFDVDGTLVRVDGAGRAALQAAMREVYEETGPIDAVDFHGKTDPAIVRELLRAAGRPDGWIDARMTPLWEVYCARLEAELEARRADLAPCPGVCDLLAALREEAGTVVGLVTGNVEGGAWRKLRACGLGEAFSFGAFGSDSEWRDDLPPLAVRRARARTGVDFRAEDVIVIGDTPADIGCARASGFRAVAVATGRYGADELAGHAPDALLATLAPSPEALRALGGGAG